MRRSTPYLLPVLFAPLLVLGGCDSSGDDPVDDNGGRPFAGAQVVGGETYVWTAPQTATLEDVPGFSTQLVRFVLFQPAAAAGEQELRLSFSLEAEPADLASGEEFDVLAVVGVSGQDRSRDGEPSLIANFRACPEDAIALECDQDHVAFTAQGRAAVTLTTFDDDRVAGSFRWPGFNPIAGVTGVVSGTFNLPLE
jgi:hypothetical protein